MRFNTIEEALSKLGRETHVPRKRKGSDILKYMIMPVIYISFIAAGLYALIAMHNVGGLFAVIFMVIFMNAIRIQSIKQRGMKRHVWKTTVRDIKAEKNYSGKGKISCVADLIFPDGHIESGVDCRFYEKDMPRFGDRVYVIAIPSSAGVIISIQSEEQFLGAEEDDNEECDEEECDEED